MTIKNGKDLSRRDFLGFMGRGAATLAAASATGGLLASCVGSRRWRAVTGESPFTPVEPSSQDNVILADGLGYSMILTRGDSLGNGECFGDCNDFTAFFPLEASSSNDGLLWVNHESFIPLFVTGKAHSRGARRKRDEVLAEQLEVGGTIVRIRREPDGQWRPVIGDSRNRRLTARTPISFAWDQPIAGTHEAIGTLGNCAGGVTPWGTVLTCEEQHLEFYGDRDYTIEGKPSGRVASGAAHGWETAFDYPPEHYGWTVEVDPRTGSAKKLVALGRFGKEGATVATARDGRCVVYSGDDDFDRCLYKFIADEPGTLESGTLYVANLKQGRWIPLLWDKTPILRRVFKSQTDVLVRARLAGLLAGGSQLDRPEDVEIDPLTGAVFVTLTNNINKGNDFGSILKIVERNSDPLSTEFQVSTFLAGGPATGFACPDNLVFDKKGNLWFTSDMSSGWMNAGTHASFKNNGLFFVPLRGRYAGKVTQIASAPVDAEFTGPSFAPDGRTLFLSVQHPGEGSKSLQALTSHWPNGGDTLPRSAVIAVQGPALDRLMGV